MCARLVVLLVWSHSAQFAFTDRLHLLDLPRGGLLKSHRERTPSASSDSGLSVASQGQRGGAPQDRPPQAGRQAAGLDFEIAPPLLEVMTELAAWGRGDVAAVDSGLGVSIHGAEPPPERETDMLEDGGEADAAPASSSVFQDLLGPQEGSWIHGTPPPLAPPTTPARGPSSREAVRKAPPPTPHLTTPNTPPGPEEDLTSLTADVDESIEQLNQLILDLDPTFVPLPTHCSPPSRSAPHHANGISHLGKTHQSGESKDQTEPLLGGTGGPVNL